MPPKKRAGGPNAKTGPAKSPRTNKTDGKGKEPASTGFKYSRDVKGTEYEGQAMTLGPGEWDSDDDLDFEQDAESHGEDSQGEWITESDATGTDEEITDFDTGKKDSPKKDKVPMKNKDPYEYILMRRPFHDYETENENLPEDEQLDEEELEELYEKESKAIPHDAPASIKADHKWILMRGAYMKLATNMRERGYRSPDALGMYIYNDFEGYGILEQVENLVQAFAIEYAKKDSSLKEMWTSLVTLNHFLLIGDVMLMNHIDDGERLAQFVTLVGRVYLTMLNSLDRADQLKSESDFKDLALVSGLYMLLPAHFADSYEDDVLDWRTHLSDYMETKKIDSTFVLGSPDLRMDGQVDDFDKRDGIPKPGIDRWGFKDALKKYKKSHGTNGNLIGGTQYDITKMSRSERARYAFDKKDPLKGISAKDLREGNVVIG